MSHAPTPRLPEPESFTLKGGCPVWVIQRPGPAIVSVKLLIRGGSSGDPAGQRGRAQLLAGLLSRGCGDLSGEALADLVEGLGDELRCEASEDGLLISLKCASADSPGPAAPAADDGAQPLAGQRPDQPGAPAQPPGLNRQREDPSSRPMICCATSSMATVPMAMTPSGWTRNWPPWGDPQLLEAADQLGARERCW